MTDTKILCALIYRFDNNGDIEGGCAVPVCVAKFDYAGQRDIFGNRLDKSFYTDLVEDVIMNEPPGSDHIAQGIIGGFQVVQSDQYQIVYGADVDGLCCVTITGHEYPSRIAISMLEDLYTNVHFSIKYGDESFSKKSHIKRVRNILRDSCQKYADFASVDKTTQVLEQVDLVKGKMQDNITTIIQNTETAEEMAIKSDQLNEQAAVFKKKSTDLRKHMQWKNLKMTIIFGTFIVLIILAVTVPLVTKAKKLTGSK
mmetsp:Transcript_45913/g.51192  ORF Transcript_45913/g.51192 Transcript_45913/m.51192 type:complete len:256 (+) Transcript_45913:59-826(+)